MDENTLERLCVDFHLGEMNADVQELLHAYMGDNPVKKKSLEDTSLLLDRASQALLPRHLSSDELPALRHGIVQPRRRALLRYRRTVSGFAVAASLVLAFMLGKKSDPLQQSAQPQVAVRAQYMAEKPASSAPFWSMKNLSRNQSTSHDEGVPIRWNSPLSLPQSGENS